jgi:hypothetical protein
MEAYQEYRLVKFIEKVNHRRSLVLFLTGPSSFIQTLVKTRDLHPIPDWLVGFEITIMTSGLYELGRMINGDK